MSAYTEADVRVVAQVIHSLRSRLCSDNGCRVPTAPDYVHARAALEAIAPTIAARALHEAADDIDATCRAARHRANEIEATS